MQLYADLSFIESDVSLKRKLVERFWRHIHREGECLIWEEPGENRYGTFRIEMSPRDGRRYRLNTSAHRMAWALFVGPPPRDQDVDHCGCDRTLCVEVRHLQLLTPRENILRAPRGLAAANMLKTHCPKGHEYTPKNTMRKPSKPTIRYCRECERRRSIGYYYERRYPIR